MTVVAAVVAVVVAAGQTPQAAPTLDQLKLAWRLPRSHHASQPATSDDKKTV